MPNPNSKLMLMIWALCLAAQRIPFAMSRAVPKPSESSTRTGMIFARGGQPRQAEVVAGLLGDRSGDVGAVAVAVERHRVLIDEVVARQELLAGEVGAALEPRLLRQVGDAGVEDRHPRPLAAARAALIQDAPGIDRVQSASRL